MKLFKVALVAGALAAGVVATGVVASTALAKPTYHPGGGPPEHPTPPPHGKAYGVYCRGASKKHVKGEKGTEFSRCTSRMEKADENPHMPPGQVCKGLSKEHVAGKQGTEFSRCVQGIAHLRRDRQHEEHESASGSVAHPSGRPEHPGRPEGAGRPEGTPPPDEGKGGGPEYVPAEPGPKEGLPPQAKAHGRRCKGKSKKHVKGEKGTPFSRCVKAAAQARREEREKEAAS